MHTPSIRKTPLAAVIGSLLGLALFTGAVHAGTVTGTVPNAKGKPTRVVVAGTALSASADANGQYRIDQVPAGSYTVNAMSGGAVTASATVAVPATGSVTADLTAASSTTLSAVNVAANRYDASDMQMAAVNTTNVLSADDLKYTAVHNVAEALGLMPGVNVFNTGQSYFGGIDGAARGEGMFASVRGLNAEFSVNLINGVNVAQGLPYSRSVQLSLLPPSGLQTIVLNKTSTADMDGDAIGGTIDFRTPTAFDFAKDTSGSVTVSGRVESRARDYDKDGLGGGVSGEFQTKFGSDHNIGLYASAYYDKRNFANSEVAGATAASGDGAWEFSRTDAKGNLAPGYDPQRSLESTGMYAGYSEGSTERYGGNASLDWKVDDTLLLYARGSFARANTVQNTGYTQLIPANVTYDPIGQTGVYQPTIHREAVRWWYETNPEKADLATIQFGADKHVGSWTFSPNIFWGHGDNDRPDHIEISARNDEYSQANFPLGANQFISYGSNGFPYPLLTPAMQAQVNNIGSLYARRAGELTKEYSGQDKGGARFDVRYDGDGGALQSVQFGVKYVDSSREFTNRDWTNGLYTNQELFGSLPIFSGQFSSIYPGKYDWPAPIVSNTLLKKLIDQNLTADSLDTCGSLMINNLNCNTMRGTEAVTSAYAEATWQVGGFEIIPGVRFEHTTINNTFWLLPHDANGNELPGHFENNHTVYNEPLPSIFVNYRPDDSSAVYRGGIWESYTRPAFVELGGGANTSVSADGVTTITEGNPNLKPIKSLNVDFSGEWQSDHGGHAMVAAYYKRLQHYIFEDGGGQVNQGQDAQPTVITETPENGGDGKVYGVEVAIRQKFQDMPEPLDGFGVGANATRQRTRVDLGMPGFGDERIQNAPEKLANAELFYEKGGFSANLSWHYSGSYVSVYDYLNQGATWDDLWIRPVTRVDLHVGYAWQNGLQVDLSIANLTKQNSYWSHIGKNTLAASDIINNGMTSLVTVKYAF